MHVKKTLLRAPLVRLIAFPAMLTAPSLDPVQPVVPVRGTARAARRSLAWTLPFVLIALLYLGASVGPALFDQNEAQYAGAVREMMNRPQDYLPATRDRLERGHWYLPTNDGIPRLQKPPLVYWFLLASMRVFGVGEFSARLPNAVVTLLWFWATFLLGRRVVGAAFGRTGALILATMAGTFIFTHLICAGAVPGRVPDADLLVLPRGVSGA